MKSFLVFYFGPKFSYITLWFQDHLWCICSSQQCWLKVFLPSILVLTILFQNFPSSHFDSKTSFDVFTAHSIAGEKFSCLQYWSSSILSKNFFHHNLIPRPALIYSYLTAMLVKTVKWFKRHPMVTPTAPNCTFVQVYNNVQWYSCKTGYMYCLVHTSKVKLSPNLLVWWWNEIKWNNDDDKSQSNVHIRFKTDVTKNLSSIGQLLSTGAIASPPP